MTPPSQPSGPRPQVGSRPTPSSHGGAPRSTVTIDGMTLSPKGSHRDKTGSVGS